MLPSVLLFNTCFEVLQVVGEIDGGVWLGKDGHAGERQRHSLVREFTPLLIVWVC